MSTMTYITHGYTSARGNHITIHRPVLTPEEREGRMDTIKQATARLVLETEKAKHRRPQNLH